MRAIPPLAADGFDVEVDRVDARGWHALLDRFDDANIYQTWSHEAVRAGTLRIFERTSHLVLRSGGNAVAAAQLRIVKLPWLRLGVAYIRWGPMWRLRGQPHDRQVLAAMLAAIQAEYGTRRGLSVRVLPYAFADEREWLEPPLCAAGFARIDQAVAQRTLTLSLQASLPELRSNLEQKWRNCLNRAEKNELTIEEGDGNALFERFEAIHREMHERKQFVQTSRVGEFVAMQRDLPAAHKMRVLLASQGGVPAAGIVIVKIGDTGVFLHGATSDAGMGSNASYLLQWRALQWLKAAGAATYNLHGINPQSNPGTYRFKAGLAGKTGRDLRYLGTYASSAPGLSRSLVGGAEAARRAYRSLRAALARSHAGAPVRQE